MPPPRAYDRYPLVAWLERRSRRQVVFAVVLVGAYAAWRGMGSLAGVLLDRWWLHSVTDSPVWRTVVWARVQLVVIAVLVTLVLLAGSLYLVRRRGDVPDDAVGGLLRRYRGRMGRAHGWVLTAIVAVLTLRIGMAASTQWKQWLLFLHGGSVGRNVPELGGDLGDYLFRLPFLAAASDWLRRLLLVTIGLTLFASAIAGELRLPWGRAGRRPARQAALAHLGILGVLFAAAQAVDYVFVRQPMQAVSDRGAFVGAGYTELNVVVPATWMLALVVLIAGFALVVGAMRGRWRVPVMLVITAVAAHVAGLVLIPAVINRLVVTPAEATRQLPYVAHNLDATREAFVLDAVVASERQLADGIDALSDESADDVDSVPLWDIAQLPAALQVLQGRTATRITDLDLDRYEVDGELRPVVVGPRSASRNDLPETGWVQQHLVYTHGNGVVAVPADEPDTDGRPDVGAFADALAPRRPELYFGEGLDDWYAIVGTDRAEQGGSEFAADSGIAISSPLRRAVLALAMGELEPLMSAELGSGSQLLYRRGIDERLAAVAPWATFGSDPYAVVTDDHVVWVVDGYTTSSTYPYAQSVDFAGTSVNYVHASLKATVDAYDGAVHLYRTDVGGADDPILAAWEGIFPGLVESISEMPAEIRAHLRYAPELLAVQSALLGRYHVGDAETLFNGTARWSPSAAAPTGVATGSPGPSTPVPLFTADGDSDSATSGQWVSIVPFSPGAGAATSSARDQLAALSIADNDDPERLELITVRTQPGRDVATPLVAQSAIDADPRIAQELTLLNANGSIVQFGPMSPLLLDDGLVWVRSIIVSGTAASTAPRLYGVVAVSNGLVGFGADVTAAIDDAIDQS